MRLSALCPILSMVSTYGRAAPFIYLFIYFIFIMNIYRVCEPKIRKLCMSLYACMGNPFFLIYLFSISFRAYIFWVVLKREGGR